MPVAPNPAQIVLQRQTRRQKDRKSPGGCILPISMTVLTVISLVLAAGAIALALVYAKFTSDLPNIEMLSILLGPEGQFRQPTRVYDRSGETLLLTLENPNTFEAEYLFLELIPQDVVDATIAALDPAFWEHDGYSLEPDQTTIPEKLILDTLLAQEPESWQRTWRMRLLALQATQTYGRETILEWFLNNADYGQLAYGIDEAARVYFGKSARSLNLAEAAILGAVAAAPAINPIDAPQLAIDRQNKTLNTMLALSYLTQDEAVQANADSILVQTSALPLPMLVPDLTNLALNTVFDLLGKDRVQRGGLKIITSLDFQLQTQTACAVQVQLDRLNGSLPPDTLGSLDCPSAALLPTLNRSDILTGSNPAAGAVVIDPLNGQVLALVGGMDVHPAGTALSPFIYLTAFTRGLSPASLVWDIPASIPPTLEGYGNADGTFHGPMRIRTAAAHDYLVPLLAVLRQIGPTNAWLTAQQSGIYSLQMPEYNASYEPVLNGQGFSVLELTHAYSMFANQGNLAGASGSDPEALQPITVLNVSGSDGRIWLDNSPQARAITTPQLAYLVTDMLSDEIALRESLGHPNPLEIARPAAAKLGQSLHASSTWAIGYTPQRVIGVWLGFNEAQASTSLPQISPLVSAGLWHALMKTAHQTLEVQNWLEPIGMVHVLICDPSGLLPTRECPDTVTETFITGSEPSQVDDLYRTFLINNQTGRLATIYTPPEYMEEMVYLVVPPEAQEWAQNQGLELPPDTYDVIFSSVSASPTANISAPEIFSYVSGEVEIIGSAGGEGFDYYRVQVGSGLNPRQWLQIGEEFRLPVSQDTLATWDTTGLDGLYALQLLVVRKDQSIETATLQVTVDNQAPSVQVLHPSPGQVFQYPQERALTFQAQVTDNLGIGRVEFWLDGRLLSSLSDPPYAAPWTGATGEHELEVRATDQAGNQTSVTVSFSLVLE